MLSGKAPIAEASTVDALRARHWSHRRPVPTGVLAVLTGAFWALWLYLVLPLVSLLLWAFGVRFLFEQIRQGGYEGLRAALLAYSSVLLGLVGVLALWIAWNVVRYGGSSDRRTAKRAEVTDAAVQEAFRLDDALLAKLRRERLLRIDLDGGGVVLIEGGGAPRAAARPAEAVPERPARPQREGDSTLSG